jgi:hypothetical protein
VTQTLYYAPAPQLAQSPLRRLLLWTVYYACWAAGLIVPATVGVAYLFETLKPRGIDDDLILFIGPGLGAAAGITFGYLLRRRRWLHSVPMALGAVTLALGAVMTYIVLNEARGFLWELALFFWTAIAVTGLVLCTAGASGLVLNRPPRQRHVPPRPMYR